MDNQVGRTREPRPEPNPLTYRLEHLTPGQQRHAYAKARTFLQDVMMDPKAPGGLKQLIREQNAVGLLLLQELLAAHVENELKDMNG